MRVCIHRGSKQIGGSCVEVESQGQRIVIDLGLPLDAEKDDSKYLPNIAGLDGRDPSLLGIFISHPHLDHFGLMAYISPNIPVGMGAAARRILTAASRFLPENWIIPAQGWDYHSKQSFETGPFRITPYLVDHSGYDSYAILIESKEKRIFYSGDFRSHGRKAVLFEDMIENPPANVNSLLLEGSSLGRLNFGQKFPTESEIEKELIEVFSSTQGLALVHTSAQNIDRIVSIFRACKQTGRKLIIDLYTAAIMEATQNQNIPRSDWPEVALFIPQAQRIQIKNNSWFELLKHHSINRIYIEDIKKAVNKYVLLFRPLHRVDLEKDNCLKDASYIYSQWEGYWERESFEQVREWLERHCISKISIHTSGHASPEDLKKFVSALKPLKVVPIHSFFPEKYDEIFSNVEIHNDGNWWEV